MRWWLLACLAGWTVALLAPPGAPAQNPATRADKSPQAAIAAPEDAGKPDGAGAPGKRMTLDQFKPLPGGIFVIVDSAAVGIHLFPKMFLLSLEKYRDLEERISALQRQLKPEKRPPSVCKLAGRLDGDVVRLQADFRFVTDQPKAVVFLGCQGAVFTEAKLDPSPADPDGRLPLWEPVDNGYAVRVPQAGEHALTVQLQVPVGVPAAPPGGGPRRGFELGLPGAAVTVLSLELPPAINDLHWNEYVEKQHPGGPRPGHWMIAVGKVKNLAVRWKEPLTTPGAGPLRTVDGQITVSVEENHVVTTAELFLQDLRGQSKEWRVWAPPQASLNVTSPPGLPCEVQAPTMASAPFILRLSEPSTERFKVVAEVRRSRPFSKLPVGPFAVAGAYRQEGIITVKAVPESMRGLKLAYHRHGDVVEQEVAADAAAAGVLAAFKYRNLPADGAGASRDGPAKAAPLELELQPVKGAVETRVEHLLRIKRTSEGCQVLAVTRLEAKPVHDGVDYLELLLPRARPDGLALLGAGLAGFPVTLPWGALPFATQPHWPVRVPQDYELEGEEGAAGAELLPPTPARKAGIRLKRFQTKPFTVVLTGTYELPPGVQSIRLELPRPVGVLDRGAKAKIVAEADLELVGGGVGGKDVPHRHEVQRSWQRTPVDVDLAWRPYHPEIPARIVADVTLRAHHARVRQEVRFPAAEAGGTASPKGPPPPLRLRVPASVGGLKVVAGGKLQSQDPAQGRAWVAPSAEGAPREPVVVEYDFPLPRGSQGEPGRRAAPVRRFQVPLLWPEAATRADIRVRFWCDAGTMPALADGDLPRWRDEGPEIVAGRDSLPALVVSGEGLDLPLTIRLLEPTLPPPSGVVVDRALIQVTIDAEGTETYRARFLVSKISADHLDVELPAAPGVLMLQVALDRKRVAWRPTGAAGTVVRLSVAPALYPSPVVLDLAYRLPRGQAGNEGRWWTSLHAPVLAGEVLLGRVRWQVALPSNFVAVLASREAFAEQRWAWHGWLPMPEAAPTAAELEHWLGAGDAGDGHDPAPPPSLVCWQASLSPVRILRVPQQAWLLACSGLFLALGLGVSLVPWARLALILMALAGAALVVGAVLWPALLAPVLYGCQPGACVLVLVLGAQWLLHRRYRRRVVFMPGFTRVKAGSSLVRGAAPPRPRDPSTIDAAPGPNASAQGAGSAKGN
jgi:hypothetical protein